MSSSIRHDLAGGSGNLGGRSDAGRALPRHGCLTMVGMGGQALARYHDHETRRPFIA
ncbi:MAG: hypothetical protein AVDCRST_MAG33-2944 [uncultured Thermomicrobiales bacterium]|uniref:Uncharacterized protein n=1 Tax=uncultured Thermomicrobiales bacterium TaxID=1645740 RepID=A0A6J4VBZ6_9BACT|nr:MAG: hypothetical protein AVDCRST_MAG33-2944 [uncultured Thermomicrobiales bacterium]